MEDPSGSVGEYDRLFGWERRMCEKRFEYELERGLRARPDIPEVMRDWALCFGYRGGLQGWMRLMFPSGAILFVVLLIGSSSDGGVAWWVSLGFVPLALTFAMCLRLFVYRAQLHPNWRRYRLDPNHPLPSV